MPNVSVMLKPASSQCNMLCDYCFYRDIANMRTVPDKGKMSAEVAEAVIKKTLAYAEGGAVSFVFQGGEPTLAGKEFFAAFFERCKALNKNNSTVTFALQTNALLLDDEWCSLLAANGVLVGVSLDGDFAANALRIDKAKKETFNRVTKAIELLRSHSVEFNVLAVVTAQTAARGAELYEFFASNGMRNLQFIPYLTPQNVEPHETELSAAAYASFLKEVYALYARDFRIRPTRIRLFDNYIMLVQGKPAEQCGMNGKCEPQLVIEADGSAYPCDFYCSDEYELGNIAKQSVAELLGCPTATEFFTPKQRPECKDCKYLGICKGGCKRYALDHRICEAYKIFFDFAFE